MKAEVCHCNTDGLDPSFAWDVNFLNGSVINGSKGSSFFV
jgi:hypothetical protein